MDVLERLSACHGLRLASPDLLLLGFFFCDRHSATDEWIMRDHAQWQILISWICTLIGANCIEIAKDEKCEQELQR